MNIAIATAKAAGTSVHRFVLSSDDFAEAAREARRLAHYEGAVDGFKYDGVQVDAGRPGDASRAVLTSRLVTEVQ